MINSPVHAFRLAEAFWKDAAHYTTESGHVNLIRLLTVAAGGLAEALFDYDNAPDAAEDCLKDIAGFPVPMDLQAPLLRSAIAQEQDIELGRQIARGVLNEHIETSWLFRQGIVAMCQSVFAKVPGEEAFALFAESLRVGVGYEMAAHNICDRAIEVKIAGQHWTIGDCITALSGLCGARQGNLMAAVGVGAPESIQRMMDDLIQVMIEEAVRHGVPESVGPRHGVAANDVVYNIPRTLIDAIEPLALSVIEDHHILEPAIQVVALAKAAGRMMAVAAAGEVPDMDHVVARPLALGAMIAGFRQAV